MIVFYRDNLILKMQAPQWTEFLQCPICLQAFSETVRLPISLACGHTACKSCLHSLQRKQCQFCSSPIHTDIDKLPVNDAILQLTGVSINRLTTQELDALGPDERALNATKVAIENLALLLKPLGGTPTTSTGSNHGGGGGATGVTGSTSGGGGGSGATSQLSRPMQRKLVTLINCQLVEPEGRARALRAARSLGERTVTELLLQHQNQQQLSSNLWAAVRQRGCQFLGPALQEECLRLILLALKDGEQLARKTLVMFVVQKLQEKQYQQASKTSVGHVVQLLYRASCFKVTRSHAKNAFAGPPPPPPPPLYVRRPLGLSLSPVRFATGARFSIEETTRARAREREQGWTKWGRTFHSFSAFY